jgi:hypothetical protein
VSMIRRRARRCSSARPAPHREPPRSMKQPRTMTKSGSERAAHPSALVSDREAGPRRPRRLAPPVPPPEPSLLFEEERRNAAPQRRRAAERPRESMSYTHFSAHSRVPILEPSPGRRDPTRGSPDRSHRRPATRRGRPDRSLGRPEGSGSVRRKVAQRAPDHVGRG